MGLEPWESEIKGGGKGEGCDCDLGEGWGVLLELVPDVPRERG